MINEQSKDYTCYDSTIAVFNTEKFSFFIDKTIFPESDFTGFQKYVTENYDFTSYSINQNILFMNNKSVIGNTLKNTLSITPLSMNNKLKKYSESSASVINSLISIFTKGNDIVINYNIIFDNHLLLLSPYSDKILFLLE